MIGGAFSGRDGYGSWQNGKHVAGPANPRVEKDLFGRGPAVGTRDEGSGSRATESSAGAVGRATIVNDTVTLNVNGGAPVRSAYVPPHLRGKAGAAAPAIPPPVTESSAGAVGRATIVNDTVTSQ
jgi:hypothetical protein